jgi:hypothetical protein
MPEAAKIGLDCPIAHGRRAVEQHLFNPNVIVKPFQVA